MNRLQDFFSGYGYTVTSGLATANCVTSTFSASWVEKYFREGFDQIDPIFKFAEQNKRRCGFKQLTDIDMQTPLFEEAKAVSADSNIMITDFLGGSTMVLGGVNPDFSSQHLIEAQEVCKLTHRQVMTDRIEHLTDKQIDLLELIEMGLRDSEISYELGISSSAIAQRKKAICGTLGLTNFQTAAQLYTARKWSGLISP